VWIRVVVAKASERLLHGSVQRGVTMQQPINSTPAVQTRPFANAAITLVVLLLVYAAFDDITTDNATTFRVEYTFLVGCAGWLLFVAWSLHRNGHRALGVASIIALASAVWAQHAIGPGMLPGIRPEYVVMIAAYLWFWAITGAMLWLAWRAQKQRVGARFTLADAVGITMQYVLIAVVVAGLGLPLVVVLIQAIG
jgi:hypothetical protein